MSDKSRADNQFKEAYKNYYSDIYRFCLSYLTNDRSSVEDVVQETFIVLYNKFVSGEEIAYIKAFLLKTAHNLVLKHIRDRKHDDVNISLDEVIEIPSQDEDIDERLSFEEYSRQISDALSVRDAELFRLRYLENKSLEEIAAQLGISPAAAGTRVYRLKNRLMQILEELLK